MKKQIGNIILIGTSHVAKESVKEIEEVINQYSPEVIGIELDLDRLRSLKSSSKKKRSSLNLIGEIGFSGWLFGLIAGYIQQKIGKSLGIEPGADMKRAYDIARENSIPVSLLDIDIKITLRKMSKLSFFKKIKMFFNLFFKSFKKEYRNKLNFDVKNGVPNEELIKIAMDIFKKEVPDLYRILIEDRNKFMVNKILKLKENHSGYIVAVVGAGHLDGMMELLEIKLGGEDQIITNINLNYENYIGF